VKPSEEFVASVELAVGERKEEMRNWQDAYYGSATLDLLKKLSENYDFGGAWGTVEALLLRTGRLP
jgi:hypothetical protein